MDDEDHSLAVLVKDYKYLQEASQFLAEAALKLLADPAKRHQMGLAAMDYVSQEFSEAKLAEGLLQIFKNISGTSK